MNRKELIQMGHSIRADLSVSVEDIVDAFMWMKKANSVAAKEIPLDDEFLEHCKTILQSKFPDYEFAIRSKYQTWIDDGWKDGNGKRILNWKNKINNTIPYLRPIYAKPTNNKQSVTSLKDAALGVLNNAASKNN